MPLDLNYQNTNKLIELANQAKNIKNYEIANMITSVFLQKIDDFINTDHLDKYPFYIYREESPYVEDLPEDEVLNDIYFEDSEYPNLVGIMLADGSRENSHHPARSLSIPVPLLSRPVAEKCIKLAYQEQSRIPKFFHNRTFSKLYEEQNTLNGEIQNIEYQLKYYEITQESRITLEDTLKKLNEEKNKLDAQIKQTEENEREKILEQLFKLVSPDELLKIANITFKEVTYEKLENYLRTHTLPKEHNFEIKKRMAA